MYWNGGVNPVLVVVVVAFVFIQGEIPVGARIEPQFNRVRLASSGFYLGAERNNRSSLGVDRNSFQRSFHGDALPPIYTLAGPEINPVVARRKINHPLLRSLRGYRIDQQSGTEHELVGDRARTWIRRKLQ